MKRQLLDQLIKDIHSDFECQRSVQPSFRHFVIEDLISAGLELPKAEEVYDTQLNKINRLIDKLEEFPKVTQEELSHDQVLLLLNALIKRIKFALHFNLRKIGDVKDKYLVRLQWYETCFGEGYIRCLTKSYIYINEFTTKNGIKFDSKSAFNAHLTTSRLSARGLGGFIKPIPLSKWCPELAPKPSAVSTTIKESTSVMQTPAKYIPPHRR